MFLINFLLLLQLLVSTSQTSVLNIDDSLIVSKYPELQRIYFPVYMDSWILSTTSSMLRNWSEKSRQGRLGRNLRRGPIQRCFGPYCIRQVYFLRKSTEFHDMCTQCQIILIHLLLPISHKSPAIAKRFPLLVFLLSLFAPKSLLDCSDIAPRSNCSSVCPPILDTPEWMDMHSGISTSVLMNLCC